MLTLAHPRIKKLREPRKTRILTVIPGLLEQGMTCVAIAKVCGIDHSQAARDMELVRELWAETRVEEIESVRAEAIAKADAIFRECFEAWNYSKKEGHPDPRFLNTGLQALERKVKLCGAEVDLKLVQQNVQVSMASPEQVAAVFSPMSAADFKAFASAHADAQLRAAEESKRLLGSRLGAALGGESSESHAMEQSEPDAADSWLDAASNVERPKQHVVDNDDVPRSKFVRHPFA